MLTPSRLARTAIVAVRRRLRPAVLVAPLLALLPGASRAGQPILVDGYLNEWGGSPIHIDDLGDAGTSGIDFERLWATSDDDWLFIRFTANTDLLLEEGSNIALYLDTDANPLTGSQLGDFGAELRWNFGQRSGTFYGNPPSNPIDWPDIRLRVGPGVTADEWEIAIGRDVLPDGQVALFDQDLIHVLVRDESLGGDRVPDVGETAPYTFTNDGPPAPGPVALERNDPGHVRIVSHNVLQDSPWGGGQSARYDRIYSAIVPDVICFQEIYGHTAGEARNLVETWLPSGAGEFWFAAQEFDRVTVSRYSVINRWVVENNLAILLPTTADIGMDVLLINCHLPCCGDDAGRQTQVDGIMSFIGDAMTPGGVLDVPANTGIVITGDMNFVGDAQQLQTLLTGDIINEGAFGPDVVPDWDGTDLRDLVPIQTEVRMPYTWYRESSDFTPNRLDFMIYTDSVLGIGNRYLLFTSNMSPAQLSQYGLFAGDSELASDHIPLVFDLFDGSTSGVAGSTPELPAKLAVGPNPLRTGGTATITFDASDLERVSIQVYDVAGRRVRHLVDAEPGSGGAEVVTWDGRDDLGRAVANGVYFIELRGVDASGARVEARSTITIVG